MTLWWSLVHEIYLCIRDLLIDTASCSLIWDALHAEGTASNCQKVIASYHHIFRLRLCNSEIGRTWEVFHPCLSSSERFACCWLPVWQVGVLAFFFWLLILSFFGLCMVVLQSFVLVIWACMPCSVFLRLVALWFFLVFWCYNML